MSCLRQVEVLVGPIAEWRGGGSGDLAVRFRGDGTTEQTRIRFSVKKHIITTASPTMVELYNLSSALRAGLRKAGAQVVIKAGWGTGLVTIFQGSLMTATHERRGPDMITSLYCLAGFGGWSRTVVAKTYGPGESLLEVVFDLANQFPGAAVDRANIDITDARLGTGGRSFGELNADALNSLSREYGFSWTFDDGEFRCLGDDRAWGQRAKIEVNQDTGLKTAEPMLTSPFQARNGVSVRSILRAEAVPGQLMVLRSRNNPYLDGEHKITALEHNGDTHASEWDTMFECFLTGAELGAALVEQQGAIGGL